MVIEFHDSQVDAKAFGEELGLHYVGTVGVLDWAHEFTLNDTASTKRSILWTGALETLEALKTNSVYPVALVSPSKITKEQSYLP